MSKIAKESIFQLLPRSARFYLTANLKDEYSTSNYLQQLRNFKKTKFSEVYIK